jgi:hypothetical protein
LALHQLSGTGAIEVGGSGGLELTPPKISSVVPLTSTSVRVNFDTGMVDNTALSDPNSYSIAASGGAAAVAINAATPEIAPNPTYADLTITEMTDGGSYELTATTIEDPLGQEIDSSPIAFTGQGTDPQVSSALAVNSTKVRITFSEPMDRNGDELLSPANYSIAPTAGAAAVFVTSVVATEINPTEVELITSEMAEGGAYEVTVSDAGGIRDAAKNPLDSGFTTAAFTGKGAAPEVLRIVPISSTRVDVVFNEPMRDNADIRDPANYVWDPTLPAGDGIETISVLDFDTDTVQLVTSPQTEGVLYTLTIG